MNLNKNKSKVSTSSLDSSFRSWVTSLKENLGEEGGGRGRRKEEGGRREEGRGKREGRGKVSTSSLDSSFRSRKGRDEKLGGSRRKIPETNFEGARTRRRGSVPIYPREMMNV
jgi:hypothetical protein